MNRRNVLKMDYLCILNAFEQTYYNRIKELQGVTAGLRNNTTNSPSSGNNSNKSSSSSSSSSSGSSGNKSSLNYVHIRNPYQNSHHYHTAHVHLTGQNNASNVSNSLLWQPWRDFTSSAAVAAAAATHHQLYLQQQQQQIQQLHQQQQQNLQKESRLTAKELPTTKWRRDRRTRAASEYQHSLSQNTSTIVASPPASPPMMIVQPVTVRPLCESTNLTPLSIIESPIDMSVTSTTIKPRASPPPPYREPLPGSTFATTLARPSVITQAPPKRGDSRDSILISNRENDNQSTESISMCDTVIDEHFRRSLGNNYDALFGKKSPVPSTPSPTPTPTPPPLALHQLPTQIHQSVDQHRLTPSPSSPALVTVTSSSATAPPLPQPLKTKSIVSISPVSPPEQSPPHLSAVVRVDSPDSNVLSHTNDTTSTTSVSVSSPSFTPSVDDHFAKALGDTWKKLQADKELKN